MKILHLVLRLIPILVSAFVLSSSVSVAELPPSAYEELKAKAPEQLTIKVVSVNLYKGATHNQGVDLDVEAEAEVIAAQHSESGLKPGSTIKIVYNVFLFPKEWEGTSNLADLSEPEALGKGMTRRAYLKRDGQSYNVVAQRQSFESIQ
jgi:hypothetical protein